MKNFIYSLTILFMSTAILSSCSDDSSSYNPYDHQIRSPFYPSSMTMRSVKKDQTTTLKDWRFSYNNDQLTNYNLNESIKYSGTEITENSLGQLSYYTDANGKKYILNKIYKNSTETSPLNGTQSYNDTITQDVALSSLGYIQSIKAIVQRTYSNGTTSMTSNVYNFTYSGEYCTGCVYKDEKVTTTYQFKWNGNLLVQVVINEQGKDNSLNYYTYDYTWNTKKLAKNYGFNPTAFITGPSPEIYASSALFGKGIPYEIESEKYSGYRFIADKRYDITPINKSFSIMENNQSLIFTAHSPNFEEFEYIFRR